MDSAEGSLPFSLPFTLGHEVVGTVVAVGDGVDACWLRRTCAVHGVWSCGQCPKCRAGRDNYCDRLEGSIGGGIGRDGGLADFMLVPSIRHLVPVGNADPVGVAPLTDAGLTAYHSVFSQAVDPRGAVVVVVGIGGLGHLALQVLRTRAPSAVIAVDRSQEARELALRLDADHAVDSVECAARLAADHSDGAGADLVFDYVGSQETMQGGLLMLSAGGTLVVVGTAGGSIPVSKMGLVPRGSTVDAPFWGPRQDLVSTIELAADGKISAVVEVRAFEDVGQAYVDLRAGRASGRLVIVNDAEAGHKSGSAP